MEKKIVIIGAGPAGLTAGMYSARAKIATVIIEKQFPGGNMLITEKIENYPGFEEGISGIELSDKMKNQFLRWGGEIHEGEVSSLSFSPEGKKVKLHDGREFFSQALIIASGSEREKLGVRGEEELRGKGVSYCAICDGAFFRDKTIAVVGGGNSALEEAIYLTRYVKKCYLIHRRDKFRASKYFQEEIRKYPAIIPVMSSVVEQIAGNEKVEGLKIKNKENKKLSEIQIDGIFVSVGQRPNVNFLQGNLKQNRAGYIITDYKMETSEKGVFACGDVIRKSLYQVVTACGEGATAASSAEKHLEERSG